MMEVNYEEEVELEFNNKMEVDVDNQDKNVNNIEITTTVISNNEEHSKDQTKSSSIDRKKKCPFMVKMYCRINGHHRLEDFAPPRFPIEDEMIVYTWKDATLKELSLLVREVLGDSDLPGGIKGNDPALKFSFNLLYPDVKRSGAHFLSKQMGWAFEGGETEARLHQLIDSSTKTLDNFRFVPGDFIDVAVFTNPGMIPKIQNFNNNRTFDKKRSTFYPQRR